MTTAYERVLDAFQGHGLIVDDHGNSADCQAPNHSSADRSVSVKAIAGKVLLHSHSDPTDEVLEALGLTLADLFDKPTTRFDYPDGRWMERTQHGNDPKRIKQSQGPRRDTALYRTQLDAEHVWIVEGEFGVHAAEAEGLVATCSLGGSDSADKADWSPVFGKHITIVRDKDKAGMKYARKVTEALAGQCLSIRIVESATGDPGSKHDIEDHLAAGFSVDELVEVEVVGDEDPIDSRFPAIDWTRLLDSQREPVEWLVPSVIAAGRSYALAATAKGGKSLTVLDLLIQHRVRCVYLDWEQTEDDLRSRALAMAVTPEDLANLTYLLYPPIHPLDTAAGGAQLAEIVARHKPDLVVLDTVSRAVSGDENESATYQALYRHSLLHLKREGVAVLRLDHLGKDAAKGQRGSSAKNDDVDCVWMLVEKVAGRHYTLRCERQRSADHPTHIEIERTTDPLRHELAVGPTLDVTRQGPVEAVMRELDELDVPTEWGRPKVRKAYAGKCSNSVLDEAIKRRREGEKLTGTGPVRSDRENLTEISRSASAQWDETAGQTCPGQVSVNPTAVDVSDLTAVSAPIGADRSAQTCSVCGESMSYPPDIEAGQHPGCDAS
ncbi:AAA family ATPase [Gordonia sp. NPDC003422]